MTDEFYLQPVSPARGLVRSGRLHHFQQLCSRVPIADGHALVNRHGNNAGQAALGCLANKPRKIKHAFAGKGLVNSLFGGDTLHGPGRAKRLF